MSATPPKPTHLVAASNKNRSVNILFNKTNNYGLLKDCTWIEQQFKRCGFQVRRLDPLEPPVAADIQIHLEVPRYGHIVWAPVNVMLVNAEYWLPDAFDGYIDAFDTFIFRDQATLELAPATMKARSLDMPFGSPTDFTAIKAPFMGGDVSTQWLWIIGGSKRKIAAAKALLAIMEDSDQPVKIIAAAAAADELRPLLKANCTIADNNYDNEYLARQQKVTPGHIVVSEAEGFSHVAAEARACGALQFATRLPAIMENTVHNDSIIYCGTDATPAAGGRYMTVDVSTIERASWIKAQEALLQWTQAKRTKAAAAPKASWESTIKEWKALSEARIGGTTRHVPPVIAPEDCPSISIVTPTYNRRKLIDVAFHNLLWSDYPIEKIQWVVVEDSDDQAAASSDKIVQFAEKAKGLDLTYIPLTGRRTVGEKRNIGCKAAKHDIIVFMDDDDHYPPTSLRRRVSWLTKPLDGRSEPQVVGCTTIALYDLLKGTSAVNVPPWTLPLGQRVSEATLAFRRSFWLERPFPSVSVAEGDEWLKGREIDFVELPPQQIIVAFTHGTNSCSRRVPDSAKPNCFWGFSADYLRFIHGLAGINVELQDAKRQ